MTLFIQGELTKACFGFGFGPSSLGMPRGGGKHPGGERGQGLPQGSALLNLDASVFRFCSGSRLLAHATVVMLCSRTCEICVFEAEESMPVLSAGRRVGEPWAVRDHLYPSSPSPVTALPFFKKNFIYLFNLFLAALGLHCCARAFSSCSERGLLFVAVCGLLIAVPSLVVEHGL